MAICITDTSALELYRVSGRLLPELLERPRTSKLDTGPVPSRQMLEDDMLMLGVKHKPYHLLFSSKNDARDREDIRRRIRSGGLPPRALIRVNRETLVTGPELLFLELAASGRFDKVELAIIGYELCGFYLIDEDQASWNGFMEETVAPTSVGKIERFLGKVGSSRGCKLARCALELVKDRSNSPMETVTAALFCFPRRLGGLGFCPSTMNHRITTAAGDRWVDVFFPRQRVGLEYKGRSSHSLEKTGRDDRRQNKLVGSGVTILNIWYEDLVDPHLFQQLVQDVADALGIRLRIRSDAFAARQKLLRAQLIPAVMRYGSETF